ncbi:hypothetical protein CHS0354_012974 [Potamilus streckersoni]|uniref:Uncharacterized protein n=1 Tax=Potamilus streckersoni TaxID=2493646 RepID=A0AAE0T7G6_9BIVA|nr:hypothetical protein CHS0354_012974 [Potamilus streckersoni]
MFFEVKVHELNEVDDGYLRKIMYASLVWDRIDTLIRYCTDSCRGNVLVLATMVVRHYWHHYSFQVDAQLEGTCQVVLRITFQLYALKNLTTSLLRYNTDSMEIP